MVKKIENFVKEETFIEKNRQTYFLKTETYQEVLNASKSIILGGKGAGKTAIFKFLQTEESENQTSRLFIELDKSLLDNSIENDDLGSLSTELVENALSS